MTTNLLSFAANERLDLGELGYLGQDQPTALMSSVLGGFHSKASRDQGLYILHGFGVQAGVGTNSSSPAQNQLLVSPGSGILAWRRDAGTPRFGMMADLDGTDQAAQSVDLTFFPAGQYTIWLRMSFTPSNATDRTFWASGDVGREYAQLTSTRLVATWEVQALSQGSNPGAEWVAIARLTWASPATQGGGGTLSAVQDTRPLYFEGQASATPTFSAGWGAGNDRSSDRGQYGIQDLRTMLAALRQCIEDVKGPGLRRWYEPTMGGLNVGFGPNAPTEGRVALGDASFYLQGRTSATAGHAYLTANVDGGGNATGFDFLTDRSRFQVSGQIVTSWSQYRTVGFGLFAETNLAVSPGRALVEHVVSAPGQLALRIGTRAINNASPAGLDALAYLCAPDQAGNLAQILFGRGDVQGPERVLYQLGKAADNSFIVYDTANASPIMQYFSTSRALSLVAGDYRQYDVNRSMNVMVYSSALNLYNITAAMTLTGLVNVNNLQVNNTLTATNANVTTLVATQPTTAPAYNITGTSAKLAVNRIIIGSSAGRPPVDAPFGTMYYDTNDGKIWFNTQAGGGWREI